MNWDGGGTDEYFHLTNLLVTVVRTNIGGHLQTSGSFQAWVTASGKAYPIGTFATFPDDWETMHFELIYDKGEFLGSGGRPTPLFIRCTTNRFNFNTSFQFGHDSGELYDRIAGARWSFYGG